MPSARRTEDKNLWGGGMREPEGVEEKGAVLKEGIQESQEKQQRSPHNIAGDEPQYSFQPFSGASSHRLGTPKDDDDFRASLEAIFSSYSSSRSPSSAVASRQLPADHSSPWIPRTHGLRCEQSNRIKSMSVFNQCFIMRHSIKSLR